MATGIAGRSAEAHARQLVAGARLVPAPAAAALAAAGVLVAGAVVAQVAAGVFWWFLVAAPVAAAAVYLAVRRPTDAAVGLAAGVWVALSPLVGVLVAPSPRWAPGSPGPLAGRIGWLSAMTAAAAFLVTRRRPGRAWVTVALAGAAFVGVGFALRFMLPDVAGLGAFASAAGVVVGRTGGWRLAVGTMERRRRERAVAGRWERGAEGERATAALLELLDPAIFKVLHDRALPGTNANLDHLVIAPGGVFVVDSKYWTGRVVAAHGRVYYRGEDLATLLAPVGAEARAVTRCLGVVPAVLVCVHGTTLPGGRLRVPLTDGTVAMVIEARDLLGTLTGGDQVLGDGQVRRLAAQARRALPDA
jgi:Nuclease-related domain